MKTKILFAVISLVTICSCTKTTKPKTSNDNILKEKTIEYLPIKPKINEAKASDVEKSIYQKAYDLWYNGNSQESIYKFKAFIKKYPNSSLADDAQRMIGTAHENLGKHQQAIEELEKVKDKYPDANSTPRAIYDMAHIYFYSLNDFTKAKAFYEEFINSATIEDKKYRDLAIEQIKNWKEETNRFKDYAKTQKEDKKVDPKNFIVVSEVSFINNEKNNSNSHFYSIFVKNFNDKDENTWSNIESKANSMPYDNYTVVYFFNDKKNTPILAKGKGKGSDLDFDEKYDKYCIAVYWHYPNGSTQFKRWYFLN